MIYKTFKDKKISALGFGCMRFPCVDGVVDEQKTEQLLDYAIKKGVNYFDTAWGYLDEKSEIITGRILNKYPREKFFLADKFPGYDLNNMDKVREIFPKQLEKCGVDYFDFYLIHNLCELNIEQYLDPKYGIMEYLLEQKKEGKIKHLGYSCHATTENTKRFLDAYGEHMEFCQIQLNWLDYEFQDAKDKVELFNKLNIPIWVMEPVRGGSLLQLTDAQKERMNKLREGISPAEWCFRFVQTVPGVVVTLSGMNDLEQVEENIKTFEEEKPLNRRELELLDEFMREKTGVGTVPCTACRYCVKKCPLELDIPHLMKTFNEHVYSKGGFLANMAIKALDENKRPHACIGCGECAVVCPQKIDIPARMKEFKERLNNDRFFQPIGKA